MKKILVTGSGGYIGSISTDIFLKNGYEVVSIDDFSTGFKQPLELLQQKYGSDKYRYYDLYIMDNLSAFFEQEKDISLVVHFAAVSIASESMKNPEKYFKNNVGGSLNLLLELLKANIKKFVFSSTAAVYGEADYTPIDENHPTVPINVYGESKLIVEQMLKWFSKLNQLNYVALRYFNACGAADNGSLGYSIKPGSHLMQNAVRGALGLEEFHLTCPEVDTPDKTPIRDYINVVDLANAHLKAIDYLLNGGSSEIINLGTGTGNSVLEIISKVEELAGARLELKKDEPRVGDPARLVASNEKAKQILDWQPEHTIEDSIKSLITWFKAHPNGWDN